MKINRLFEIVYILLERKTITAKELADMLEVSVRTIYRDIDTLCESNIPIYSSKGAGGGISILPNYILNKSVLTDEEQKEIVAGLQGLRAVGYPEADNVLGKISSLFSKTQQNWIDVDFSSWGSGKDSNSYFYILKDAILNNKVMEFNYYSSSGESLKRTVEPVKLISKNKYWYLYGYCTVRADYRFFKLSRITDLKTTGETFETTHNTDVMMSTYWGEPSQKLMNVELVFSEEVSYRIYDDFDPKRITKMNDGKFSLKAKFADEESNYAYFLSFGHYLKVVSPIEAVEGLKKYVDKIMKNYC